MSGLTVNDPVSLASAISSDRVIPGDVIVLLPGTYVASTAGAITGSNAAGKGVFRVIVSGISGLPITIKAQTPGTVTINGGIEMIGSTYVILRDLIIEPTITDRAVPDYPHSVYCSSAGCKLIHNTIIGGLEGVAWFGVGESEIYGNDISGAGWFDGNKNRGTGIYTHNQNGGKVLIQHNIFGASYGEQTCSLWSASSNNVRDYDVRENAFVGNGLLMASHEGTVTNNLVKDNHLLGEIRIGEADQAGEQDKVVDGNRVCAGFHSLATYYQTQATIQNNVFVKSQADDGTVDDWLPAGAQANVWLNNHYHNLAGNPFFRSDNSDCTWEEWVTATGETGDYSTSVPANATFTYNDKYTVGKQLVCTWNYANNPSLTAVRT